LEISSKQDDLNYHEARLFPEMFAANFTYYQV